MFPYVRTNTKYWNAQEPNFLLFSSLTILYTTMHSGYSSSIISSLPPPPLPTPHTPYLFSPQIHNLVLLCDPFSLAPVICDYWFGIIYWSLVRLPVDAQLKAMIFPFP